MVFQKKEFDNYFQNKEEGVAIELGKIKTFKNPKDLSHYNIVRAPQSFQFVK